MSSCLLANVALLLAVAPGLLGETSLEYQVKAAYLYNFAKFVTWPKASQTGSLTICVMGKDPFGPILDDTVRGKSVRGEPISVRRVPRNVPPQACQIVFVELSVDPCRGEFAARYWSGMLLVGEGETFTRCGGMIGLVVREGRVQFDINLQSIAAAGLEVSSKLIQVAANVEKAK